MLEFKSAVADSKRLIKKHLWITLLILGLFILDRIFKNIFLIKKISHQIGFFNLSLIKNSQIVFGYLPVSFWSYLLIALVFTLLIYKLIDSYRHGQIWFIAAFMLVILGGFSNFLDRIKYGFVIDYVHLLNWSFFNLADLMIWVGIMIIIIKIFTGSHRLTKIKNRVE